MRPAWGISANSHDAALAVVANNTHWGGEHGVVFASHSERFSGIKNDPDLNQPLINAALQHGKPRHVVWYENPFKKSLRQLYAGQGWRFRENNPRRYLAQWGIDVPIHTVSHHHSHAAFGYYTSGFEDATVLVLDSIGEWETLSVWQGVGTKLRRVYSQRYPHSIGLWYSAMTERIGLKPQEDEYILMGMAAYGDGDRFKDALIQDFFEPGALDEGAHVMTGFKENLHAGAMDWRPELTEADYPDIAAGVQAVYEAILKKILLWCGTNLPSQNFVFAGGCALNCSANRLIHHYYDRAYIPHNPGDAGSAIGAVLALEKTPMRLLHPFLGYNINRPYPVEAALTELMSKGIVGVANGAAEFGPRAFGNRSLLADPRGADVKDRVNAIKARQNFRPFAPAILEEHAGAYFEGPVNRYMQYTARCRNPDAFPGIVHVDGTSRVQTVPADNPGSPGFRRLLERWYEETGCPMLLNTSLNIKGYPMVNDERDALMFSKWYGVSVL